jgi:DNA-directed RNA polymerase subunit RPC12/RpoP
VLTGRAVKIAIAVAAGLIIFWLGLWLLRGLAQGEPAPPPPGEMRKVKLVYRCSVCGAEVRMTAAPNDDPEPPRHCQEEMDLVAPIE